MNILDICGENQQPPVEEKKCSEGEIDLSNSRYLSPYPAG